MSLLSSVETEVHNLSRNTEPASEQRPGIWFQVHALSVPPNHCPLKREMHKASRRERGDLTEDEEPRLGWLHSSTPTGPAFLS